MKFLLLLPHLLFAFYDVDAQGPMFQPDPKSSPQRPPNATLKFGDIALTAEQEDAYRRGRITFNAVIGQHLRWKDAIIPYNIDCSIENLPDAVQAIHKAIAQWERKTCIRFVKWTDQKFKLNFFRNTHCWGNVGQVSYSRISVGPGCEYEHVMAHEIGHVVGLYHEQNRKDRDQWVKVLWENVGQFKEAFDVVQNTDPLGIAYDYESIMHYPWTAFSSNGKPTMQPIRDTKGKIPYIEISKDDIELVSRMYNCPAIEKKRKRTRFREQGKKSVSNVFDKYDCVDKHKECEDWAANGKCISDIVVKNKCKRSCQVRSCFGGPCTDNHPRCKEWKEWGHCKFVDIVQMECQHSCNPACKGGTPPPTEPPPTRGPTLKPRTFPTEEPHQKGDFHSWPNYNYLGTGVRCIDKHSTCADWAKLGECEKNTPWMLKNCRKSCKNAQCDRDVIKPPGTCNEPFGISIGPDGTHKIPDAAMTASTTFAPGGQWKASAENARLYFEDDFDNFRIGAWCAGGKDPDNQYVDVDLGQVRTVAYIATQGRDQYFERVAKFKIAYSNDGKTYTTFKENGGERLFFGNCDHVTPVLNKFEGHIRARYIRYLPIDFNWPCLRMELYGC